jgi:putative transposase
MDLELRTPPTPAIVRGMRDWLVLIVHLIVTTIRTMAPGGTRAVIAESLLLKQQLLILNRSRKKAPRLRALDRILLGLGAILVSPQRILKVAVAVRPATLLRFHRALVRRKYQSLFSSRTRHRPGPKGPSKELIATILEIKRLNPRFGCPRIAQQISHAFGLEIDKDVVRRILASHPLPKSGGKGPSWLSAIAQARDSLWSVDLFRCESILLKSFWVMVVMDVFTRRIVGFGVEPAHIDGISVCRMFNQARRAQPLPKRLRSMLRNERYIGRQVWNRSEGMKDPDSGKRTRRERPPEEWTVTQCAAIVDGRIWGAVAARIKERAIGEHSAKHRPRRHLLSGLTVRSTTGLPRLLIVIVYRTTI